MTDNYGRNITYARIAVTDLCNLRCRYCMPPEGVVKKEHAQIMSLEELFEVASVLVELGVSKIRLTGGEPLVRKGLLSLVEKIGQLDGLQDFAITTNGVLLEQYARGLYDFGVRRVNISMDSLKPERFREITGCGEVDAVWQGIRAAQNAGLKVKLNVVLVNNFNTDEIKDFVALTQTNAIDVRFIELMPIGDRADWTFDKYVSGEKVLEVCPDLKPIAALDKSSPAVYYKRDNASSSVGLIRPMSCRFCADCNRIRITADGKIKTCLHTDDEVDLRSAIGNTALLKEKIMSAVGSRQEGHNLDKGQIISRNMVRIGG